MQLQNEVYVLKKQFVNERNFNALINFLKNFIKFFSSETTPAFNNINIIIKSKRFAKHADFKIFIDDFEKKMNRLNLKFDEWLMKIINKFFVNNDHYNIFLHKIVTIIDWIKDTIVIYITVYRQTNVNYFQIFDQVLQILCDVYKEKNFKNNSWRIYIALKQKRDDSFVVFFSKFRKLNNIL